MVFCRQSYKTAISKGTKTSQLFYHFSKISEMLKNPYRFWPHIKKQKSLLLVQDVDTRWNPTYFKPERLKRIKSTTVRYYAANYKNDEDSIVRAEE